MTTTDIIRIARSYPYIDIEANGNVIRKQIQPTELSEELLRSYVSIYDKLTIVPKKMVGSSPMRIMDEAISFDKKTLHITEEAGLGGFELPQRSTSASSELYKIMYENAKEEAREYKRKYEDAISDKHKAELELAGSKSGGLDGIIQGLAGFAPMLLNGGAAAPQSLGDVPAQQPQQPVPVKRIDVRLQAIAKHYTSLAEDTKEKVYTLLTKLFTDITKIDELNELI